MFAFPMLIVWIILAGVLICVMAAAITTKVRGESIGVNPLTLLTEAIDKLEECKNADTVELLVLPRIQRVIVARCEPSDSNH